MRGIAKNTQNKESVEEYQEQDAVFVMLIGNVMQLIALPDGLTPSANRRECIEREAQIIKRFQTLILGIIVNTKNTGYR